MSILIPWKFPQLLLAQTSSCHNVRPEELIAILAVLGSLLTFAATASVPPIAITIPAVVAKVIGGLAIGASWTSIIVPFDALLHIVAVAAVVESIKQILGCG
jgi:hypothetical protein